MKNDFEYAKFPDFGREILVLYPNYLDILNEERPKKWSGRVLRYVPTDVKYEYKTDFNAVFSNAFHRKSEWEMLFALNGLERVYLITPSFSNIFILMQQFNVLKDVRGQNPFDVFDIFANTVRFIRRNHRPESRYPMEILSNKNLPEILSDENLLEIF